MQEWPQCFSIRKDADKDKDVVFLMAWGLKRSNSWHKIMTDFDS